MERDRATARVVTPVQGIHQLTALLESTWLLCLQTELSWTANQRHSLGLFLSQNIMLPSNSDQPARQEHMSSNIALAALFCRSLWAQLCPCYTAQAESLVFLDTYI
jgi:hypothetical protein